MYHLNRNVCITYVQSWALICVLQLKFEKSAAFLLKSMLLLPLPPNKMLKTRRNCTISFEYCGWRANYSRLGRLSSIHIDFRLPITCICHSDVIATLICNKTVSLVN